MATNPKSGAGPKSPDGTPIPQPDGVNQKDKLEPAAEKVTAEFDKAAKQGFFGVEVDQTPNENYTVSGVTAGKPTPETKGA